MSPPRRLAFALALALAPLLLAAPTARAQAEPPRLFLLPVQGGSWLDRDARRALETRLTVALTRSRRVQPVGARDLSPAVLRTLPAELGACVSPACLRALGRATNAPRALALELLDEGGGPALFGTLYDTQTGEAVDRRELPRPSSWPPSRAWSEDVARSILGVPAHGPPPPEPTPPVAAPPREPLLTVHAAPGQGAPEAQALAATLAGLLSARGRPRLALAGVPPAEVTHRALVTVDRIAVSQRPHHLHHYRTGSLAATLTIADARGAVVFADRAAVQLTERSRHASEQQVVEALVQAAAARWLWALEAQGIDQLMQRRPSP